MKKAKHEVFFEHFSLGTFPSGLLITVRAVGGPLPEWVQLDPNPDEDPVFEFVIQRERIASVELSSIPTASFSREGSANRILIVNRDIQHQLTDSSAYNLVVEGLSDDLDTIAESLARLATGVVFIGSHLPDVYALATRQGEASRRGRAVVIRDSLTDESARKVALLLEELTTEGFDGGVFWFHLFATGDHSLDLSKIDRLASALFDESISRSCVLTGAEECSITAMVLTAFPRLSGASDVG